MVSITYLPLSSFYINRLVGTTTFSGFDLHCVSYLDLKDLFLAEIVKFEVAMPSGYTVTILSYSPNDFKLEAYFINNL